MTLRRRMQRHMRPYASVSVNLGKLTDPSAEEDADKLAEGSIRRIGTDAANRAPVDTGHLRNTMTTGIERSVSAPKGVWDLIDGTDYTMVQELGHATKDGFIVKSVRAERPRYHQIVGERFKKRR